MREKQPQDYLRGVPPFDYQLAVRAWIGGGRVGPEPEWPDPTSTTSTTSSTGLAGAQRVDDDDDGDVGTIRRRLLDIGFIGIDDFLADADPAVVAWCLTEVESRIALAERRAARPLKNPGGLLRWMVRQRGGAP